VRSARMRVAISGAGIAGLTLAAALKETWASCHLFEQAGQFKNVGAGIQLAPNASRVLHQLGLGPFLDQVAVRPEALEMRRWSDGRVLRRTELGRHCMQMFGAPYYALHRADLHRGLVELLPGGTVHLGQRCTEFLEHDTGVELRFAGDVVENADVAVGADGIHSLFRQALTEDRPVFSGQLIYRGLVPASSLPFLTEEPMVLLWLGPNQHFVCYPICGGSVISFGATVASDAIGAESWTAAGSVTELLSRYRGWDEDVCQIIAAAKDVGVWALHDRNAIARWSTARTTLVGDAAHPMLPFLAQGANQAIEDAMVLAQLLERAGRDSITAALSRYELLRRPRTEEIHSISRRNAGMLHLPDGVQQRQRDDLVLPGAAGLDKQAWLYGYDARQAGMVSML
jgi:salicylate hydroxylase